MNPYMKIPRMFLSVVSVALVITISAYATKLLHRNLSQMANLADRVFVGLCIEAVEVTAPIGNATMPYTRYTFQVAEGIKGSLGQTVTIKQLGRMQGLGSIVGMPAYREGVKYMLFMLPESEIGLSSPVGLLQGAFEVFEDKATGQMHISNSIGNRGLFKDMTSENLKNVQKFTHEDMQLLSVQKGPIEYTRWINLVKKLVE